MANTLSLGVINPSMILGTLGAVLFGGWDG